VPKGLSPDLAFGAALAIFLILEIIRLSNLIYTQLSTRVAISYYERNVVCSLWIVGYV